jgi:hypothetical protein
VIFAGFFYKSHSGKIYAPGSPSSGLKRSILFRGAFSVTDPRHFGVDPYPDLDPRIHASAYWIWPDPDPDPAIFVSDLQDANKKLLLITF